MAPPKVNWEKRMARAMTVIEELAEVGGRMPFNEQLAHLGGQTVLARLVAAGKIRIEVYTLNWRVVQSLRTGRRTKECPHNVGGPYKVLEGEYDYDEVHGSVNRLTKEEREEAIKKGLHEFPSMSKRRWEG